MKIAIIAHDGKKAEMVQFLSKSHDILKHEKIKLIATGTTGSHVEAGGLKVEKVASGPKGGDAQIAAQITEGKIDMVFFFRDPFGKHPHEPDILMLVRICDVYNIPLATNPASAELMLTALSVT